MKLGTLLLMFAFSPLAFSGSEIVREILASRAPSCPKAETIYNTLLNRRIEDLSRPYLNTYFEVSGVTPDGQQVMLYLTKVYSCDWGSFGGGGCSTKYQCMTEFF